jgi:TctA family transporter
MNIYPPLNTNPQNNQMYSQPIQPVVQQYMPRQKNNSFPKAYTIVQIIFFIVLCLAMIALQTVITIYKFQSYSFGAGFWVAAYFIGAIICLFNIRKFNLITFLFCFLIN